MARGFTVKYASVERTFGRAAEDFSSELRVDAAKVLQR